jgi:hypothetical protein
LAPRLGEDLWQARERSDGEGVPAEQLNHREDLEQLCPGEVEGFHRSGQVFSSLRFSRISTNVGRKIDSSVTIVVSRSVGIVLDPRMNHAANQMTWMCRNGIDPVNSVTASAMQSSTSWARCCA